MAMTMDLRDFFRLRCSELLVMERDIWQLFTQMAEESKNPALKEKFELRRAPMRQHISNLEQVVDRLGGIVGPEDYAVTQGMLRRHRSFLEMRPPQPLLDLNNALEGEKIEGLEIAAYSGLVALARQLALHEIVTLLEQNLIGDEHLHAKAERDFPTILTELTAQMRRAA